MARYARRRVGSRRTGGYRRGRKLQQNGPIVPAVARNAVLAGAMARYGPAALRAGYNIARDMLRERRMQRQARARAQQLSSKRTSRMGTESRPGRRSGDEVKKYRGKVGMKQRLTMNKLVAMRVPKRVLYFSGVNPSEASNPAGYYWMSNRVSGSLTSAPVPMYAVCLSGTIQAGNGPNVLRQAIMHSTGRIEWQPVQGLDFQVVNTPSWSAERADPGADTAESYRFVEPEWYQIKLNMYGARTQHTTFIVEYIQCAHDFAAIEDEDALLSAAGTHGEHYRDMVYGHWQNVCKPLVTSAITGAMNRAKSSRSPYTTLRRWQYAIAPSQTIESDTSPNNAIANLFLRDHRLLDHGWVASSGAYDAANVAGGAGQDDRLVNPSWYNVEAPRDVAINPASRTRRYLIIRAVNTTRIAQGAETDDNTPSFDIVVRRSERLGVSTN